MMNIIIFETEYFINQKRKKKFYILKNMFYFEIA